MSTGGNYEVASRGLFGQTRSALLAMLYGHADQSFYLRQLVRAVGAGHGALQRELKHLTEIGLIVRTVQGNQVLYRANSDLTSHSTYASLSGLLVPATVLFSES